MGKLLILGIGNYLLTDDGVGVYAAQELLKDTWPENVTVIEGGTFTQDIFYLFEGYDKLLVLDVIHAGHEPGTLYKLTEEDLISKESQRLSIHDVDLIDSLNMCEMKSGKRPYMTVVGMEPEDIESWNIGLTEPCKANFDKFMELARKEISQIMEEL